MGFPDRSDNMYHPHLANAGDWSSNEKIQTLEGRLAKTADPRRREKAVMIKIQQCEECHVHKELMVTITQMIDGNYFIRPHINLSALLVSILVEN